MAAGYENLAGFRPGPGPDMISGSTLIATASKTVKSNMDLLQFYSR